MSKTAIHYLEALAVIAAVAVPVHYLGGLDWPWSIVLGAAASILVRALTHRRAAHPTSGEKEARPR